MKCKEFERLYRGDRVVFMLAMELFLENGREHIMNSTQQELSASAAPGLGGFLMLDKINAVAQTAKEFAALKTEDLLSYTARCFQEAEKK